MYIQVRRVRSAAFIDLSKLFCDSIQSKCWFILEIMIINNSLYNLHCTIYSMYFKTMELFVFPQMVVMYVHIILGF